MTAVVATAINRRGSGEGKRLSLLIQGRIPNYYKSDGSPRATGDILNDYGR
jgi:hypothetical protein